MRHNEREMLFANGHRVYKYPLDNIATFGWHRIHVPYGAKVVMVGHQIHIPTVWLEVSTTERRTEYRVFYVYGTGHDIDDNDVHVGSYKDGRYVWHVYESNA